MNKKLRIAWLCHFSNSEVRKRLPLSKYSILGLISANGVRQNALYSDFAPWVSNLAREFENFNDVDLHIISPHNGLLPFIYSFIHNGIHYHFFKPDKSLILFAFWNRLFKSRNPKYLLNRFLIGRILGKIAPDLVNLIGAENPYYSIASLDIKGIPLYLSVQTVYSNPRRKKIGDYCDTYKWDLELKIHSKVKYFGCAGRLHRDLILHNNPSAIVFKMFFPIQRPLIQKDQSTDFDFVFFASYISNKKGVEDAITALALAKSHQPSVTLLIIGRCDEKYKALLAQRIKELNVVDNISFHDYFPLHTEMLRYVTKARFALLPVKMDVIPGTVIEAILLGLPVVTYITTGTPYLNKEGESILLSEIDDIDGLSKNMIKLLETPMLAKSLSENAIRFVEKEFDNFTLANNLLSNYRAIIANYHGCKAIPEEQLFDITEFPIY